MINFCDLALYISTPVYFFITTVWQIYWSAARNICYNEAFANLPKNFSHAKKSWFTALSHISLSLRWIKYLVLIKLVFPTGSGLLYIKRWQKNAENYQQIFINHRLQRGHGRGTYKLISWVYLQIPTGHYHLFTGTNWHYINVNACISFTKKLFHIAENLKKKQIVQTILIWTDKYPW